MDAVRNSVCHTATVIANSFMHCGTTSDQFLRDNLEWLARATNWAKFTATASLGVIHKIVRHGGSLGLGLAAMGTARQDVYDLLKTNLYQDDAVTGIMKSI
ncbi:hypothetical protein llap_20437 [Limosa lapponica baueri]|uniref:Uncharacterized protein n=1 Tax=Limosa lapponica baueri TaxID=1758121 RepID=A0A2I0T634_LIMLA|nr:hypothetical protein llap_20437 [Limosa lapponica baueri]